MKLEDQVCSLELAIKLKELGVKQDSLFYWTDCEIEQQTGKEECCIHKGNWEICFEDDKRCKDYSAFTVAELGEKLPTCYSTGKTDFSDKNKKCVCRNEDNIGEYKHSNTEVNARAKMVIHLIENGYLKIGAEK